jgi:energy-converting hydrogenase Eha subunit E
MGLRVSIEAAPRSRRTCGAAAISVGLIVALAGVARAEPVRVALLAVEELNLAPGEGEQLRLRFAQVLRARQVQLTLAPPAVSPGCAQEIACQQQLGHRLGVHKLVALRVGKLGDTTVLRLTAFDVTRGMRQGTWQELLRRADARAVAGALERLANSLLPPPPARRPFYARWWFWTVAGVVVAGSITAAVLATRPRTPIDSTITPPPRP